MKTSRTRVGSSTISLFYLLIITIIPNFQLSAQGLAISLEAVVSSALANSAGIESATWDLRSSEAKAREANWRRIPSLSFSANYQLSALPEYSMTFGTPPASLNIDYPSILAVTHPISFSLQYPVFAGFRLEEAAAIAKTQALAKETSLEIAKRSLIFEVERAYWEALRAMKNHHLLRKNLELAKASLDLVQRQLSQGTATAADRLAAQTKHAQADIDLGDAAAMRIRANLNLANLAGGEIADALIAGNDGFRLSTETDFLLPRRLGGGPTSIFASQGHLPDDAKLIEAALASRPETRASILAVDAARHGLAAARAALYPTLGLSGSVTLANPGQRIELSTDSILDMRPTLSLGLGLSYDIGSLPANSDEVAAQEAALMKAEADGKRQRNAIALDVRNCALAYSQAMRDAELVRGMIGQAMENVRVMKQRLDVGTASELDVLGSEFSLLRAEFNVANREIDVQETQADLARALAAVNLTQAEAK